MSVHPDRFASGLCHSVAAGAAVPLFRIASASKLARTTCRLPLARGAGWLAGPQADLVSLRRTAAAVVPDATTW